MTQLERICKLLQVLAGHEFEGMRNSEIADRLKVTRSKVTRDLQALSDAGMVEQISGKAERWRLGPKIVQIGLAHNEGMARLQSRVDELKHRYSRSPN